MILKNYSIYSFINVFRVILFLWFRFSAGKGRRLRVGDGDFDFYAGFDGDGSNLFDDLRWRMKVDHALVNAHLEPIPSFGTFTTGRLPSGDSQRLRRHSDGSFDLQALLLGSFDQIAAHFFETLDVS